MKVLHGTGQCVHDLEQILLLHKIDRITDDHIAHRTLSEMQRQEQKILSRLRIVKRGENSVHFLNQVDESDLMAIIGEEQTEQPPAVCNCTEKCKAGEVNTACPVCSVNMYSCTGKEATPEEPAEQEQPQNGMGGLLIFLVVGLLGGGAALYYVKFMKPKQNVKGSTDLDEFDFDEYDEDEPEEADSADTEQEDEDE